MGIDNIEHLVNEQSSQTFRRGLEFSRSLLERTADTADQFLTEVGFPLDAVCLVAVGSVGRLEALEASDLDLLPVVRQAELVQFRDVDAELRRVLSQRLGLKVSAGTDLTCATGLSDVSSRESIGGKQDDSSTLTRRVVVVTEGRSAGGRLSLRDVRAQILATYGSEERTSGRHTLTLCNDIARYYRQLCMDYAAKVSNGQDWGTRNLKLRHSRKFWYIATAVGISALAVRYPRSGDLFRDALVDLLDATPADRLVDAVGAACPHAVGDALERFSWFLEFMSRPDNRGALANVQHDQRYEATVGNPFPALKYNSDLLHQHLQEVVEQAPRGINRNVLNWFLL